VSDFFAVVHRQRACRSFRPEPVDEQVLAAVLGAATMAPSAENRQPWTFVVVTDEDSRARIGDLTRRAWRGGARTFSESRLAPTLLAEVDHGAEGGISAAPVLIVVGGDTSLGHEGAMAASIFPAVQNLLLAATACGLGSALTTLTTAFAAELRDLVGLPEHVLPMAVVPLGWPTRSLGPPRRQPLEAKAHRESYGAPWIPRGSPA